MKEFFKWKKWGFIEEVKEQKEEENKKDNNQECIEKFYANIQTGKKLDKGHFVKLMEQYKQCVNKENTI
jgi:hypothetical protein